MPRKAKEGYLLTKEEVEYFWTCLFSWQERLGLIDWRITRSAKEPSGRVLCSVGDWDFPQRQCSVKLKLNWYNTKPSKPVIEQTAIHEVLHILLADLIEVSKSGADQETLFEYEHSVINRLERLLIPGEEGK